ncbi:MAG TPA: Hsp20/alpha crystallin family protein [Rhizomicrobium sp.]|jgi:HSP20 family protein|nr:Hsp20/alpha crystallin family protein [Rhizomicrobium sp.]
MSKDIEIKRQHSAFPAMSESWKGFRQEVDSLFDRFASGFESFPLQPFTNMRKLWTAGTAGFASLAVDVAEDDKAYTITAELPGVSENDIEVSIDDDMLVIRGEKRQEKNEREKNHYLSERCYGTFQRMFSLPRGADSNKVEARFQAGVLVVTVPKTAQTAQARRVEVKAA